MPTVREVVAVVGTMATVAPLLLIVRPFVTVMESALLAPEPRLKFMRTVGSELFVEPMIRPGPAKLFCCLKASTPLLLSLAMVNVEPALSVKEEPAEPAPVLPVL